MDIAKIRKKMQQPETGDPAPRQTGPAAPSTPLQQAKAEPPAIREQPQGVVEAEAAGAVTAESASRTGEEAGGIVELLTFKLFREDFAFRISELDEILKFQHITHVPKLPDYVLGITSLRGKVIPVIDLKRKLSLSGESGDDEQRRRKILIIKGPKGPIGAAVDSVAAVVRIAESEMMPPPSHLSEEESKFVTGVAVVDKRFVSIVNMQEATDLHLK
ncbi:MAG: chemotaxis protein CheW [Nitrospirota bacterium]